MKVLIIEDEKRIGELLLRLIDWESLGFELLGYVCDGYEGYQKICRERPEIVITDIRMPTMTGLEIIAKVREEEIPCHFIVISGYQQFEYAKTALQYQVDDYLLKPINKEELTLTLEKSAGRIRQTRAGAADHTKLKKDLSDRTERIKGQLLQDFLQFPESICKMDEIQIRERYCCEFTGRLLQFVIIKIDCIEESVSQFFPLILGRCQKSAVHTMKASTPPWETLFYGKEDYMLMLLAYSKEQQSDVERWLPAYAKHLDHVLNAYEGVEICVCPGKAVPGTADLREAFASAKQSAAYRLSQKADNYCRVYGDMKKGPKERSLSPSERTKLKNMIELRELDKIPGFLQTLLKGKNPGSLYRMTQQMIEEADDTLRQLEQYQDHMPSWKETKRQVRHAVSVMALIRNFSRSYVEELESSFAQGEQRGKKPIREALLYMEAHYGDALTLESVSEAVHLSPNYFSTVFKKEMEISFIDYLTGYRMNQAKKLLRESNKSIGEIAEQVGYHDARYFSRLFSKTVGITPNKYRKL